LCLCCKPLWHPSRRPQNGLAKKATANWPLRNFAILGFLKSYFEGLKYTLREDWLWLDGEFSELPYSFETRPDADTLKRRIEEWYGADPQYLVINENGELVIEDGRPIVAWKPWLGVRAVKLDE
jgi:hypothetical protein